MNSGYSSQRSAPERIVASDSSAPCCQLHIQTGSMWALPIMWMIMALPPDAKRDHLERSYVELDGPAAIAKLDPSTLRLLEQIDPLDRLDRIGKPERDWSARAVRLVDPQHKSIAAECLLERSQSELRAFDPHEPRPIRGVRTGRDRDQAAVERIRLGRNARLGPVPGMREDRIRKAVLPLVGQRIGIERAAQQADGHHVLTRIVPVLAIIQDRHAVPRLRHVDEAVRRPLELRLLP